MTTQEYFPLAPETYRRAADAINKRVRTRQVKGIVVTSDQVWSWIKERHPTWQELDREKVFQKVKF